MDTKPGNTANLGAGLICTLTDEGRADRMLEWADLQAVALSSERLTEGVASTFRVELADEIEDLVAREAGCCGSWLDATIVSVDTVLRLEVTSSNPEGQVAIHRFSGLANE